MLDLTFKDYLRIVSEDTDADVAQLQGDIATLDTEMAKRSQPLLQNKGRLTKMLTIKLKQKELEDQKKGTAQSGNQTTTPGSTGQATPGQGAVQAK